MWKHLQSQERAWDAPKRTQLWKRGVRGAAHSSTNWWDAGDLQAGPSTCVTNTSGGVTSQESKCPPTPPAPARERINWPWCQLRRRQRAFVPKEIFSTADQCRTTSLLNVKGKIFFSAFAKRMTSCMIEDGHISTATWKGRIPVFLGCQKHTGVVRWSVWLKLAKAIQLLSGWIWPTSRDKSLTGADLDHYHIPQHMEGMSVGYFGGIRLSFTALYTTQWESLRRGTSGQLIHLVHAPQEEEGRRSRAGELASQGAWTNWDLPWRKTTWGDVQFPRLDVAPWCKEAKKILAELTVPWEDRVNRPLEEEEDGQIPRPSVWLQWDSRHGASWLRSAAEESLPSQFVERSQPLDGQERRGRWQLAGWGRQQTDPVATADPPPGDSSTLWRRQECENQGLQHPFPSSPRCLITELCGFTFHLCYFIRNRNVIQHAHLTVMWRHLQPNFTSQDNLLHTGWQTQ